MTFSDESECVVTSAVGASWLGHGLGVGVMGELGDR
jgi:hypothetical protein